MQNLHTTLIGVLTAPDDPFAMMKKLRMKQTTQRTDG